MGHKMTQSEHKLFVRGISKTEDGRHKLTAFVDSPESGQTIVKMFGKNAELDIAEGEPSSGIVSIFATHANTLEGLKTRVIGNHNKVNQEIVSYALHMERT